MPANSSSDAAPQPLPRTAQTRFERPRDIVSGAVWRIVVRTSMLALQASLTLTIVTDMKLNSMC
ncbi:hypothetical protein MPL1032_180351 [Mesorhizobium plurifarium]|uniref:Uncharacterized protein n=1 Tax=Mesorhizobium plurifarium TaxID=69974 RepID=A0A090G1I3_MESPL|nr:hypothetical protein MPL1032_180351 [Mesorhizobium plurifarium]CDX54329.1 hypothetical protein MPL3365_190182 [Mesorhizobium plurifarium]